MFMKQLNKQTVSGDVWIVKGIFCGEDLVNKYIIQFH